MMAQNEPIPYELTDDGADPDSHLYPVDSTYHRCCNAIGQHAQACNAQGDVRLLAYLRGGAVTLQVDDGSRPFTLSSAEAQALAEHLMVLAGQAVR
ncbi:hypothetical protein [Mycolicibacter arupensis]|jgi:hypothetical protein|uniref:Uncharacterized protein n=1 Tax=Mycolicibacter arupensis TaxID=342002 RepID=A0A0F5MT12_9MYCO|nr:hypothetical protein [Mycolicibacter arupensis]KAA1430961.1 hypothetical protein F0402_11340 [Mycolicibacter arupensis]KKB97958.1 hypothetical protein WR43_16760 [Mycolicibacter arupensis]MCV7274268.1 hypothetical protein [Mycolicibacter arupensis]OQZ92203.1 hypothetical protein BST15_19200 [Mycolicibacter arupensis]